MTCNAIDIKDRLERPIILIGMMGTGKTHIGRMLAAALDLPFQDSDAIIETKAGAEIPEIFSRDGEEKFRAVEARTIQDLLGQGVQVIATGGGAVINPETLRAIKAGAVSVWISSSIADSLHRVSGNANRPLLNAPDPAGVLRDLLDKRTPLYSQADIHVDNPEGHAQKTLEKIMVSLDNLLKTRSE